MISIVLHLCLIVSAWPVFLWYALSSPRGCEIGNTQSRWPCGDKALFGLVEAAIAPRPRHWPPAAPVPLSNKTPLSFFSLSF